MNDPGEPVFLVNFQNVKASQENSITKTAQKRAREWLARINVLIRLADEADKVALI